MNDIAVERAIHPAAWKGADLTKNEITVVLNERHLAVFQKTVMGIRRNGLTLQEVVTGDDLLAEIREDILKIADELLYGRGVLIVRGWPIDPYSIDEIGMLYCAFGRHIGYPVVQNGRGERLVHVRDFQQVTERVSTSNRSVMLHTDLEAVVGLLALQKAKSGGVSTIASARAIHDKIAERHPEYLAPLFEGYPFAWRGDHDDPPINTNYAVPVFSEDGGQINVFMQRGLTPGKDASSQKALDYFQEVAQDPELTFSFLLEPGEASFMCNYSVLHARNSFEDWLELERRRHLLRLWLQSPQERRPIHPNLRRLFDDAFRIAKVKDAGSGRM